jgi:hypothetical protein
MGITPDYLAHAKAGRRGLPLTACLTMAELLEIDPVLVIYASALSAGKTRKKPAGLPPDFKSSKSGYLATPAMRLLSRGANIPASGSPANVKRAEKLQKAFAALDLTSDPSNFYKLLFRIPVI